MEDDEEAAADKRYYRRRWLRLQQTSLLLPPLSPYRKLLWGKPCSRRDMSEAVDSGDIFKLRTFRMWWNVPLCTATQPGYGEIYTTLQLTLIRRKEALAAYMLLDPLTDVLVKSVPNERTALMVAAFENCSLGLASQLLHRTLVRSGSSDFINTVDANGNTALDCASYLSPIYLMLRRYGALHASELQSVRDTVVQQ